MNPGQSRVELAPAATDTALPAEVLATLTEIGEGVNSSLDLDEVLARTAALIKRHIDYEIFGVLMVEGGGAYLRHYFSIGYPKELVENLRVPIGQGITGPPPQPGIPCASAILPKTIATSPR